MISGKKTKTLQRALKHLDDEKKNVYFDFWGEESLFKLRSILIVPSRSMFTMFTILIWLISMLTFTNQHQRQITVELVLQMHVHKPK